MTTPRTVTMVVPLLALLSVACGWLAPRERAAGPAVEDGAVVFRFFAPNATRVQVAGDWPENNWGKGDGSAGEADIGLMSDSDGDGVWELSQALEPGRYRYLFWVNENTWRLDPGNPEDVEGGPQGVASMLTLVRRGERLEVR